MMNGRDPDDVDTTRPFRWLFRVLLLLPLLLLMSCNRLDVKQDLTPLDATLVNQNGEEIRFPDQFSGRITLVGYIYTTCPDICPLTTQRMNQVVDGLTEEERQRVQVVGISMDPDRDSPDVLARYADAYGLSPTVWSLLSGERRDVLDLLEDLEITVRRTPTRFTDSGEMIYFLDHTDRVSLIDPYGQIRRHYVGSELDSEAVVRDIRELLRTRHSS